MRLLTIVSAYRHNFLPGIRVIDIKYLHNEWSKLFEDSVEWTRHKYLQTVQTMNERWTGRLPVDWTLDNLSSVEGFTRFIGEKRIEKKSIEIHTFEGEWKSRTNHECSWRSLNVEIDILGEWTSSNQFHCGKWWSRTRTVSKSNPIRYIHCREKMCLQQKKIRCEWQRRNSRNSERTRMCLWGCDCVCVCECE